MAQGLGNMTEADLDALTEEDRQKIGARLIAMFSGGGASAPGSTPLTAGGGGGGMGGIMKKVSQMAQRGRPQSRPMRQRNMRQPMPRQMTPPPPQMGGRMPRQMQMRQQQMPMGRQQTPPSPMVSQVLAARQQQPFYRPQQQQPQIYNPLNQQPQMARSPYMAFNPYQGMM